MDVDGLVVPAVVGILIVLFVVLLRKFFVNKFAIRNSQSEIQKVFTGIIEELGRVRSVEPRGENAYITIEARLVVEDTKHGDSISVNGVCLTALDIHPDSFAADVSRETLDDPRWVVCKQAVR